MNDEQMRNVMDGWLDMAAYELDAGNESISEALYYRVLAAFNGEAELSKKDALKILDDCIELNAGDFVEVEELNRIKRSIDDEGNELI